MAKPQLVKVRALFLYFLNFYIKRGCLCILRHPLNFYKSCCKIVYNYLFYLYTLMESPNLFQNIGVRLK